MINVTDRKTRVPGERKKVESEQKGEGTDLTTTHTRTLVTSHSYKVMSRCLGPGHGEN